ncbi:thiosulfate sulfurtransferase, partial [Salmonella enterica subsp. enterica serovar Infantis]
AWHRRFPANVANGA